MSAIDEIRALVATRDRLRDELATVEQQIAELRKALRPVARPPVRREKGSILPMLRAAIASGRTTVPQIAEACDMSHGTAAAALAKYARQGAIVRVSQGHYINSNGGTQ